MGEDTGLDILKIEAGALQFAHEALNLPRTGAAREAGKIAHEAVKVASEGHKMAHEVLQYRQEASKLLRES